MKKNLLSKISSSIVTLTACLALLTIVLPFGKIIFDESGISYEPGISTYADEEPEYMNYR